MNLSLSEATKVGGDSVRVTLLMTRQNHCGHDRHGFASEVEFLLLREGSLWVVVGQQLMWIT
jgi:hypothetical protein